MTSFLNTTDKNGLINICESLTNLGDGGISGNAVLLKQFTNYINIGQGIVRQHLLKVDRNWKADDYNYTNVPDAPITFVLGQSDYELPVASTGANLATLLRVNYVYYVKGNSRVHLSPMIGREQYNSGQTGIPSAYYFDGKSIWFDVAPDQTTIDDIQEFQVDFSRLDDPFVSGDTTQQPGFIGSYHHVLAFYATYLYYLPTDSNLARIYASGDMNKPAMFEAGVMELMSAHARMNGDRVDVMTPQLTPYI